MDNCAILIKERKRCIAVRKIVIALPKGQKLLGQAYRVFERAGYACAGLEQEIATKERKQLEFLSDCGRAVFLLVRAADIPQYIDRNWADIGISAFDCYREYELSNITAKSSMRGDNFITDLMPDLGLCKAARFCVAGRPEFRDFYNICKLNDDKILTAATQHPNIAANYFKSQSVVADIVTITGSSEIMPKHGEVDVIFDIVETGRALEENGLVIFEEAMPIQTKVLVSKAALKYDENMQNIVGELKKCVLA
jgi:ATP phosphoribosyltransferase